MEYLKKYSAFLIPSVISMLFIFGGVLFTYAQDFPGYSNDNEGFTPRTGGVTDPDPGGVTDPDPGGVTDPGSAGSKKLNNPLKSTSITQFILDIIDVLLIFAVPIIILFIMYAGFLFTTARGNESQITKAKSALLWAIVGGVIALGAKLIITVIEGTIKGF